MNRSDPDPDPGAPVTDGALRDLTDEARATAAVSARRAQRWLEQQAGEEGSFTGVLLDLGERDQLLAVSTRTGRSLRGVVRTIGDDFVGLRAPGGEGVIVPLAAITAVRAEPGARPTLGDRLVHVEESLAAVLQNLAGERPWICLHTVAGEALAGELRTVGQDLLVLHGHEGASTYVPLSTVGDVVLP